MDKEKLYLKYTVIALLIYVMFSVGYIMAMWNVVAFFPVDTTPIIHVAKALPLPDSTIKMIEKKAEKRGFNIKTALRIAECESQIGKFKKNWEGSSASGLFQFMPNTFKSFCTGDIKSDEDQTDCFMNLYPKYAGMWECK